MAMWRGWAHGVGYAVLSLAGGGARRAALYDLLYSLNWGETITNNYGFSPAHGDTPERFQLALYTKLLGLLGERTDAVRVSNVLEISCGRGGGLRHLAQHLPRQAEVIGLDFSVHAIAFCKKHYAAISNLAFVRGHALHLPFKNESFDLVINVEASHVYGDDAAFLSEVRRVLRPQGRFLYADYRNRKKIPMLEQLARAAGLAGEFHDITQNVVAACGFDAERRRQIIRSGVPRHARLLLGSYFANYAGLPGTSTFKRFRSGYRMYFLSCMTPRQQQDDARPLPLPSLIVPAGRIVREEQAC